MFTMVSITNVGVSSPKAAKKLNWFWIFTMVPITMLIHPRLLGPTFGQSMQDFWGYCVMGTHLEISLIPKNSLDDINWMK